MKRLRKFLRGAPIVGPSLRVLRLAYQRRRFPGSAAYWEERYRAGDTSGPGSAGINARFKADFLNTFVEDHSVRNVIEFGCGDGRQLALAIYPTYVGLDVAPSAIEICRSKFADDPTRQFYRYPADQLIPGKAPLVADLSLSLDVIYHLIEDEVFTTYMADLFSASRHWVILYTSDSDRVRLDRLALHVRLRPVARYVARTFPQWSLIARVENANPWKGDLEGGSLSDFYVYELR